jgi:hypothetical protein
METENTNFRNLEAEAIRLFKVYDEALQKCDTIQREYHAAYLQGEVTAKELGHALIAVKEAMPHGDFGTWWVKTLCPKYGKRTRSRVLYCMSLASGVYANRQATNAPYLSHVKRLKSNFHTLYNAAKIEKANRARDQLYAEVNYVHHKVIKAIENTLAAKAVKKAA